MEPSALTQIGAARKRVYQVPSSSADFNRSMKEAIARYDVVSAQRLLTRSARLLTANSTALIAAAARGADEIAAMLIKAGLSVRLHRDRALCAAVENGHADMVKLLLAHKADPTVRSGECLYLAAVNRHILVLSILLDTGAFDIAEKNEALVRVAWGFKSAGPVLELLIEHGADPGASFISPVVFDADPYETVRRDPAVQVAAQTGVIDNLAALMRHCSKKSDSHNLLGCAIDSTREHRMALIDFIVETLGRDCAFNPATLGRSLVPALEITSDILLDKWLTLHAGFVDPCHMGTLDHALMVAVTGSVRTRPSRIPRLLAAGADPWPALTAAIETLKRVSGDAVADGDDRDRTLSIVLHLLDAALDCDGHAVEAQVALAGAIASGQPRLVELMLTVWCGRPLTEAHEPFDLIATLRRCYSTGIF